MENKDDIAAFANVTKDSLEGGDAPAAPAAPETSTPSAPAPASASASASASAVETPSTSSSTEVLFLRVLHICHM